MQTAARLFFVGSALGPAIQVFDNRPFSLFVQGRIAMTSKIAEWIWRLAVLLALGWIGLQLQRLHEDIVAPPDDSQSVASSNDDTQDSLDSIHADLDSLAKKVDAILVVMARSR